MSLKPPYKGANNGWLSVSLFHEASRDIPIADRSCDPIFTLYHDKPGLISMRSTFVELGDVTGYEWAQLYLKSWIHFQFLLNKPWFQQAVSSYVEEIETRMKSEAIKKLREIAAGDSSQATGAAKYIAGLEYKKAPRGRPSKAELDKETSRLVKDAEVENEDAERIGLRVIQGGKGTA